jgi:hypothetical protein
MRLHSQNRVGFEAESVDRISRLVRQFKQIEVAGSFRVHYNVRGSGRNITVLAESSAEARRTVMEMIPGAVVTGVHRIK